MNAVPLCALLFLSSSFMMIIIDHHYYGVATIICLEKKLQKDYEEEGQACYKQALSCNKEP